MLKVSLERRFHRQTITVTERQAQVESLDARGSSQVVFTRHWAQVKLRRPAARLHPTEEERRGLALRLQRLIGRIK